MCICRQFDCPERSCVWTGGQNPVTVWPHVRGCLREATKRTVSFLCLVLGMKQTMATSMAVCEEALDPTTFSVCNRT